MQWLVPKMKCLIVILYRILSTKSMQRSLAPHEIKRPVVKDFFVIFFSVLVAFKERFAAATVLYFDTEACSSNKRYLIVHNALTIVIDLTIARF